MARLGDKLARLGAPIAKASKAADVRAEERVAPTLDQLRERMQAIMAQGRSAPRLAPQRARESDASSWIEHAFVEHERATGPLYLSAKSAGPGHRVGHVPIWAALSAQPELLALLAIAPELSSCDFGRALYLDTETTGLMGGTGTVPFLIGLGFADEQRSFVVEQLLLRRFADEAAMLEHVRERLEAASVIVTFNGKSFDMPLLRARATMNRLAPLPERPHLDLLHVARRIHKHRLRSCSLASVEEHVLGRARVGDVAGADICAIYHHYVRTRDVALLEPVVEHNSLDVISMFALVGLYGEPLESWADERAAASPITGADLAAAARVSRRAGDLGRAAELADASITRGAGAAGYRARGDIQKARGDKARALSDYEAALRALEEGGEPSEALAGTDSELRLTLCKLYEHHARAYDKALELLARGTAEPLSASDGRKARLLRKKAAQALPGRERAGKPGPARRL